MKDALMPRFHFFTLLIFSVLLVGAGGVSSGQTVPATNETVATKIPLDVQAESVEYERAKNMMIAAGHVVIRRNKEILRADFVTINMESYDVYAEGNVSYESGSDMWVGDRLHYNFRTGRGDFGVFTGFFDPFYIQADSSKQISDNEYELENAIVTTCEGEKPRAYFKCKRMTIVPGRRIYGKHVTLHIKGIPIMYSPFWSQNIGARNFISMTPGFSSKMYGFLLTDVNYRLTRKLEATTHLDYRMRRGFGLGQDVMWSESGNVTHLSTERFIDDSDRYLWDPELFEDDDDSDDGDIDDEEGSWFGDVILYFLDDQWPDEGEEQEYDIEKQRYRMRLYHSHNFDEYNYAMLQLNYLSDPKIIEQFFRSEYRASPEPENYLILGHRADKYALTLMFQKRLNDFYTTVAKLPELSFDVSRQQILESDFYYEGEHSAVFLDKEWESADTNRSNFSTLRIDSRNMVYYSTKQFGFLNVMPRAGYRGTYYSETKEDYKEVVEVPVEDDDDEEDGHIAPDGKTATETTFVTNRLTRATGAEFRSLPELGLETSFKAFKVWDTHPGEFINDLRHIVEPYADYSFVPEPNVLPANLYQFDEIDELDKKNEVKIGIENKLQTRRDKRYNLISLDTWITYRLDPDENEEDFGNLGFDARSEPIDKISIRMDGEFDHVESRIEELNTRLRLELPAWYAEMEHRYRYDRRSLLTAETAFSPHIDWVYGVEGRYDIEDGEIEQYAFTIQRTIDCVSVKAGFERLDDEYGVWLQFWFSRFPKARVDVSL